MMGKTHVLVGAAGAMALGSLMGIGGIGVAAMVLASAPGSLLPDIDIPQSKLGRVTPFIPKMLNKRYGHRSITHSLWGLFLVSSFSLAFIGQGYCVGAFLLGYVLHILADMLNPSGVMLLYPNKNKISIGKVSTNSELDRFIWSLAGVAVMMLFYYYFWQ